MYNISSDSSSFVQFFLLTNNLQIADILGEDADSDASTDDDDEEDDEEDEEKNEGADCYRDHDVKSYS